MKETRRQCIESLARHVLFDAYKESALMSTHMVAFLLLTKYRRGVTLDQLANDLDWLRDILHREKGQSLSAFGECEDLVRQAMFYLGKELVATEKVSMKWSSWRSSSTSNSARNSVKPYNRFKSTGNAYPRLGQQRKNNAALWQHAPAEQNTEEDASGDQNSHIEIVYLKPVLKLYGALQLHYYSNSVVSLFHLESVVGKCLCVSSLFQQLCFAGETQKGQLRLLISPHFLLTTNSYCTVLLHQRRHWLAHLRPHDVHL